jgi:2-methylaconitate cis-trans-isomerase PrpF
MSADGAVPVALIRGGTSKGAHFHPGDLPAEPSARDDLLLRLLGSPDLRQIDGIGGGHPLTSKVVVIRQSEDPDADVDYLFLQVHVDAPIVSAGPPCGNILGGVGPYAIEVREQLLRLVTPPQGLRVLGVFDGPAEGVVRRVPVRAGIAGSGVMGGRVVGHGVAPRAAVRVATKVRQSARSSARWRRPAGVSS